MSLKPDDAAFASRAVSPMGDEFGNFGLTAREYFSGLALQGILASSQSSQSQMKADIAAAQAIDCADKLIEALNR